MRKNKNSAGFTLIELVVVMCIFGMIMGAILNIIKPTNEVFKTNEATMQTNLTGSGVTQYLDGKLKYATSVLVLKDYAGVPEVSSNGSLAGSTITYNNCLVIDNNNLRGACFDSYTNDTDTAQKRMGCTGFVFNVEGIESGGFDFTNATSTLTEDYYGNYEFDINASVNNIDDLYTIDITLDAYEPKYEGGVYNFNKAKFNTAHSINLANINIDTGDTFLVQDYIDFGTSPDYTTYPQASAPASVTSKQAAYYSTAANNTYTYIFYTSSTTRSTPEVTISFKYANSDADIPGQNYIAPRVYTVGSLVDPGPLPARSGFYPNASWVDSSGVTVDFSAGVTATVDTTYYAVYTKIVAGPQHLVEYVTDDGSYNNSNNVDEGDFAPSLNPQFSLTHRTFIGWYKDVNDPSTEISLIQIYGPTTFIGKTVEDCHIIFKDEYGNDANDIWVSPPIAETSIPGTTPGTIISMVSAPIPSDTTKVFDYWLIEGTSDKFADMAGVITSDMVLTPVFKDKPAANIVVPSEVALSSHAWWDNNKYSIQISNLTGAPVENWEISFDLPEGATKVEQSHWAMIPTVVGNRVTLTKSSNCSLPLPATGVLNLDVIIAFPNTGDNVPTNANIKNITITQLPD